MRKNKNAVALGLLGNSSWEHKIVVVDFSHDVAAGAITITKAGIVLPIPNTSLQLGGPQDAFPDPLTAVSGARVVGTGKGPLAILTGVFAVHYNPSVGVYNPATGTFQVFVASLNSPGAGAGGVAALTAAFSLVTGANNVDPVAITAPAERQVPIDGGVNPQSLLATAAQLYAGDVIYVTYASGGAVDPTGKVLACVLVYD